MILRQVLLIFLAVTLSAPIVQATSCDGVVKNLSLKNRHQLQIPFVRLLEREGMTLEEAHNKLDEAFDLISRAGKGLKTQKDLEAKISGDISEPPTRDFDLSALFRPPQNNPPDRELVPDLTPEKAIDAIPALIYSGTFDLNIAHWMEASLKPDGDWTRTKPALRFIDTWFDQVSPEQRRNIVRRLIETDEFIAAEYFSLYMDVILQKFHDDPQTLKEIVDTIVNYHVSLGALSSVPLSEIPRKLKDEALSWTTLETKPLVSDSIRGVKHCSYYAGSCAYMQMHRSTFLDASDEYHGHVVLIYVQNRLIGSMKMAKQRSILGLRTVRDPKGRHPVVVGGVYSTSKEIVARAEAAAASQGKWAHLDLDNLDLRPVAFLNDESSPEQSIVESKQIIEVRKTIESQR